jgi:uncharacterized protein DUF6968
VIVRIGKPRKFRGYDSYYCPFEIHWPDRTRRFDMGGVDALQALCLCLQTIATDLYTSPQAKDGTLTWLDGHNYGLPYSEYIADLVPKTDIGRKRVKRSARRSPLRTKGKKG